MDPINTNNTNTDDVKVISDETIEEVLPVAEDIEMQKKPLSETEVEAEVGADIAADAVTSDDNLNTGGDTEAEKAADPLV